jgi:hypothetical protein
MQALALLAAGLQTRAHVVPSQDDQVSAAVLKRVGDIEGEGGRAAVVRAYRNPVDEGAALDGPKVQQHAPCEPCRG